MVLCVEMVYIHVMILSHDAVFDAIINGFVVPQRSSGATTSNVLTLIWLGEHADCMFLRQSLTEALKQCKTYRASMTPRGHGNYIPALSLLQVYLNEDADVGQLTQVLFFTDGWPSDRPPPGFGSNSDKVCNLIVEATINCCSKILSSGSFKFHAVGFGQDEFAVLKEMTQCLPKGVGYIFGKRKYHHEHYAIQWSRSRHVN